MYFQAESDGVKYEVTVQETKTHWRLGLKAEEKDWKYHEISKDDYRYLDETVSFIFNDSSYLIDVTSRGTDYTVYTRGTHRVFTIFNEESLLHESLKGGGGLGGGKTLTSGMPGKIVKVFVKAGDTLKEGDPILIMEAMKMENEMRAQSEVKVKEVHFKPGDTVEAGATLVTFE